MLPNNRERANGASAKGYHPLEQNQQILQVYKHKCLIWNRGVTNIEHMYAMQLQPENL
jgi:hypothetical protein